jgi:predicted ATPase/class 3 adenylate cyclase
VTFLFTDIEGSTRLAHALGAEGWSPLLVRHREISRAAIEPGGGIEVQTSGDGFFIAFTSAPMAVASAVAAQRALAAEPWPEEGSVRVRMGLHTGEGWLDQDGSYVGNDVNRAARVAAAGHGGQVVLSEAVAAISADRLPAGVRVRDLGEHRLKDLQAQRLLDLEIEGLESEFPPIRSLDARPNNLPTQLTSFVGRERELAEAERLLAQTRLLTLTGPGGTGKTRLSLQLAAAVASRFADGIFCVALEPVREPALIAPTIAGVLGVTETHDRSAEESLATFLAPKELLLVLDNFEQVVEGATVVSELLRAAPRISVIVSSRAPLHVSGEQEYPVPGLPIPPDARGMSAMERENLPTGLRAPGPEPEVLERFEAVRLFVSRAQSVNPAFRLTRENAAAVAAICAQLQGMPLAIELAAARIRLLPPEAIVARLDHQLDLLASGARDLPDRQRTLRGAIAWSYELLNAACQKMLDRASVFVGGFSLDVAELVCGPSDDLGQDVLDGTESLVDQSLVRRDDVPGSGEARFRLLDTIREYAGERLADRGEALEIERRHRLAYVELARRAAPELRSADQRRWLDLLEREHDNLRAAIRRAIELPDPETALDLGYLLWRFWQQRGHLNEARSRLEEIEARPWARDDPLRWARLQEALGGVAYWHARMEDAARHYDEAQAYWETQDDPTELANALYNRSFADLLNTMEIVRSMPGRAGEVPAIAAEMRGRLERALPLYRAAGDRHGEGSVMWAIGTADYFVDRPADAEHWFVGSLAAFEEVGDETMAAWARHMQGTTELKLGKLDDARETLTRAIRHFHAAGDVSGMILVHDDFSAHAAATGDFARAGRLRGAARALQATTGTNLAIFIEDMFESYVRPSVRGMITPEELERYAAEGAAMTLDDVVAYALEAPGPTVGGAGTAASAARSRE